MRTKGFHLGDVLSVITGRNIGSPEGLYNILNFMSGDNLFEIQFGRIADECRPYLLAQFPELDSLEMQFAVGSLILMLETCSSNEERHKLILEWLSKLISGGYGVKCEETLEVQPLPGACTSSEVLSQNSWRWWTTPKRSPFFLQMFFAPIKRSQCVSHQASL